MVITDNQRKYMHELTEPLKFVVGYILIYAALRLAGKGLIQLLVSTNPNQRFTQSAILLGAVTASIAAHLLYELGIVFLIVFTLVLIVFAVRKAIAGQIRMPAHTKATATRQVKPAPHYALNHSVMTFGEQIERAKPRAKPKTNTKKAKRPAKTK